MKAWNGSIHVIIDRISITDTGGEFLSQQRLGRCYCESCCTKPGENRNNSPEEQEQVDVFKMLQNMNSPVLPNQ